MAWPVIELAAYSAEELGASYAAPRASAAPGCLQPRAVEVRGVAGGERGVPVGPQ